MSIRQRKTKTLLKLQCSCMVFGKRSRMLYLYTQSKNQIRPLLLIPFIPSRSDASPTLRARLFSIPLQEQEKGAEENRDDAKTRKKKVSLSVSFHFPCHIYNPALKLSFLEKRLYFYCSPPFSFPLHAFASVFSVLFTVWV